MEKINPEFQIKINEDSFKGAYSNAAMISHTQYEFLLDFIFTSHGKGILTSRIIVSPNHAKQILRALNDNVALYEKNFGEIKEAPASNVNFSPVN